MKSLESKRNNITIIFLLSLFFLFAFSSVVLLLLGCEVYQKNTVSMEEHYSERNIASYLTEKIRQNDSLSQISIINPDDTPVLCLSQNINGISYTTYLYVYDNYLHELFTRSDLSFSLEDGQEILPLSSLQFDFYNENLLEITYADTPDNPQKIWIATHTLQSSE